IEVKGQAAIIEGGERLSGAQVKAPDLRAGASLLLAGVAAQGETQICNAELITRGYEKVVGKFTSLGARISGLSEEGDGLELRTSLVAPEDEKATVENAIS
ncbi:MAG TPA: hypothetical protein DDW83_06445, partial [Peptococcaceae bacterium]|nr:hypothetical protein [Peptococcaceae bacterium]